MKKETIDKIKELAAFLIRDENADKIKKRIRELDSIKNSDGLRRFILHDVIADNYNSGNKKAILTSEDYINYIFPYRSYWSEIRDLLIIAIYQEMHERNLISEELKVDFESEEIEEGNNNNVDSKIMNVYLNILNGKNNNNEDTMDLEEWKDIMKQHKDILRLNEEERKSMNDFLDSLTPNDK